MKRIVTLAILLGALFIISPNASAANVSKEELYGAYIDFLEERLKAVGYVQPSSVFVDLGAPTGVLYAALEDFDGDGQDELYMMEFTNGDFHRPTWFVYTYQNGKIVLSNSDSINIGAVNFGIAQGKSGKKYIYEHSVPISWEAWELSGGKWHHTEITTDFVPAYSESWTVNGHRVNVYSNVGTYYYTVKKDDATLISFSKEYPSQYIDEISGKTEKLFDALGNKPTDWAPQTLIKQLETGYVPSFRIPSSWAQDTVDQMINEGVVPSSLQKLYQRPITRAEFCSLAVAYYENITGATISERATFNDTTDINVQKMAGLGIVGGVGGGRFEPNETLTREQAAIILSNMAVAMKNPIQETTSTFADNSTISSWAQTAVGQVQASGIMNGVGHNFFDPQGAYTREQSIITMKQMDSRIVPCEEIRLNADGSSSAKFDIEPIQVEQQRKISATIVPENTTNKNLTWTSSDESIAKVDDNGVVTGLKPGHVKITSTATNGISASIDIEICDYIILPTSSIKINCLYHKHQQSKASIDYLPDELLYAGSIVLDEYSVSCVNTSFFGDPTFRVMVSGNVTAISSDVDYLSSYIKWIVRDFSGNIIDSGLTYSRLQSYETGDDIAFMIDTKYYNKACTIEFFGDDGGRSDSEIDAEAVANAQVNAPTIRLPQLPFTQSASVTVETGGTTKWAETQRDTLTISNIYYDVSNYNRKRDCYEIELYCSGTVYYPYINYSRAPNNVYWKLFDSDGEFVSSGIFSAPTFDYTSGSGDQAFVFSNERMSTVRNLLPGMEYTLVIGGRYDILVAP